jgi:hypothetical protein
MASSRFETSLITAAAIVATMVLGALSPVQSGGAPLHRCLLTAAGDQAIAECVRRYGQPDAPGSSGPQGALEASNLSTYQAEWLPACAAANPSIAGSASQSCPQAHSCPNRDQIQMALWLRQTRSANGDPLRQGWTIDHFECRSLADAGPVRRQVGWVDVVDAVRRVGIPPGDIHAPHFTLVNLETTFYTRPHRIDRVLRILGYAVDVEIHPSRYTWHWGDGTSQTTATPGRPYPSHDVTHTYRHATETNHDLALSVDVTYTGRYRVDGNAWTAIPQPITISGPPTALPVKQASAVLVTDD